MDYKSFFSSKTCMAQAVIMLVTVTLALLHLLGIKASEYQVLPLIQIVVAVVGGIVVWYGRATANGPLRFGNILLQPLALLTAVQGIAVESSAILAQERGTDTAATTASIPSNLAGALIVQAADSAMAAAKVAVQPDPAPQTPATTESIPGYEKPGTGGFIRLDALIYTVLMLVVAGFAAALLNGCAVTKNLTGPERARIVAQESMRTWKDAYDRYKALEPTFSAEELKSARSTVSPAINRAKPAVLAFADAAEVWTITADKNATAAQEVQALAAKASDLMVHAEELLNQVRR